jgi:two-component system chemotaxis sensor kinase CheA
MMVDREKLARLLMATYLDELQEHVATLNRDLLAMEDGPTPEERPELFNLLFRAAHSLKGASRAVSVDLVEKVCHQLEDVLGAARDGQLELMPPHFIVLFRAVDGIEDVGQRLRASGELADSPLHAVLPDLTAAATGELDLSASSEPTAASSPPVAPAAAQVTTSQPNTPPPPTDTHDSSLEGHPAEASGLRKPPTDKITANPKGTRKAVTKAAGKPAKRSARKPRKSVAAKAVPKVGDEPVELTAAPTPAPSPAPPTGPTLPARTASASVRVAAEKLDALLAQSGELLVARRRVQARVDDIDELRQLVAECRSEWRATVTPLQGLAKQGTQARTGGVKRLLETVNLNRESLTRLERGLESVGTQLARDGGLLNQVCTALEDEVHRVRMLPFSEACNGLDRVVRDVARATGKQVKLVVVENDVELDRAVLEGLKDPLMHLVRNGVDHGIETPQERTASGKPAVALLTISASLHGAQVEIVVEDDGKGFDVERIREKAISKGLPQPENDHELTRLVFMPGFSTASSVTVISGRGVGLDVVQSQIEALQGSVDLSFSAGRGSRFTLKLPLTLTTTRAILVRAGWQTYAIPTVNVQQVLRISPDEIRTVAQRQVLPLGGPPIPIARLTDTLGMKGADDGTVEAKILVVVMASGQTSTATIVDELLTEQEITIKRMGHRIRHVKHISGGTLLPSGETALVLNVANVMRTQFDHKATTPLVVRQTKPEIVAPRRLLVVDDSVTTRALMQAILESAGFSVQTAADGRFALEKLDQTTFDLVVSDIDMPRLNGFGLTEAIRKSDHLSQLPVILVTANGSDEDKSRGIQAGADAYIIKADFGSNNLVETIQQLL